MSQCAVASQVASFDSGEGHTLNQAAIPSYAAYESGSIVISPSKRWRPGSLSGQNQENSSSESVLSFPVVNGADEKLRIGRESSQELDRSSSQRPSAHSLLRSSSKRGDAFDPTELIKARISTSGQDPLSSNATPMSERTSESGRQSLSGAKKYRPTPSLIMEDDDQVAVIGKARRLPTRGASRRGDLFDPSSFLFDGSSLTTSIPPPILEDVPNEVMDYDMSMKAKALSLRIDEMEKKLSSMDLAYEIAEDLLKSKELAITQAEARLELALVALYEAEKAAEEAKERCRANEKASEHTAATTSDLLNAALVASEERVRDERIVIELGRQKDLLERAISRLQQ